MITIEIDLDWSKLVARDLAGRFPDTKTRPTTESPEALRSIRSIPGASAGTCVSRSGDEVMISRS